MLGWLYVIGVILGIAVIVYLDRGSIGRGHIEIDGIETDRIGIDHSESTRHVASRG